MADHITALKRRRAAFAASGQADKAAAVDAEIARLRSGKPEPKPEPRVAAPVVETAEADLSGVEAATAVRRRGRPPRQG
jgi:hypothetical protein